MNLELKQLEHDPDAINAADYEVEQKHNEGAISDAEYQHILAELDGAFQKAVAQEPVAA